MNPKHKLLLSTAISTMAITAISSLGYISPSQASSTNLLETDMSTQVLSTEASQTLAESPSERLRPSIGKATYTLADPAIQFDYDPSTFVLESSREAQLDSQILRKNTLSLLSKEDYLTVKNAGDELGDFPNKLQLGVYSNPDGIPALDWITGRPGKSIGIEQARGLTREADTTVAGRDAWTFSYTSLFEYNGIIFQTSDGEMVVITAYQPELNEAPMLSEKYAAALATMVQSMQITVPVSAYK